jgi:hypothetical protein
MGKGNLSKRMRQTGLICHTPRLKWRTYLDRIRTFRLAKKSADILHQEDYCHVPKNSVPWILLVNIYLLINSFSSVRTSFEY